MKQVPVFQSRRVAKNGADYWAERFAPVEGRSLPQPIPNEAPPAGGRDEQIRRGNDEKVSGTAGGRVDDGDFRGAA